MPGVSFGVLTKISIHAPAKGATKLDEQDKLTDDISIHAPAKGATAAAGEVDRVS